MPKLTGINEIERVVDVYDEDVMSVIQKSINLDHSKIPILEHRSLLYRGNIMNYPIELKDISSKIEFHAEVVGMYEEAVNYLTKFNWCKEILNSKLYLNLGTTLCIFLFEIDNSSSKEDAFLWLIVGDLPTVYLDIHGARTTKQVLEDYVSLAEDWVGKVRKSESVDDCYPFDAEPSIDIADLLEKKVSFIRDTLIDNIEDIAVSV